MKLVYLAGTLLPSRAASALHVVRMSQAFAALGHQTTLYAIRNPNELSSLEDFFGASPELSTRLYRQSPVSRGGGYYFAARAFGSLLTTGFEAAYGRHPHALLAQSIRGRPFAYEAHVLPADSYSLAIERRLFARKNFRRLVCITQALADDYTDLLGKSVPKIQVLPDAADPVTEDARPHQPWPGRTDAPQVGYVGHLYSGKGMELISQLPHRLPNMDFHVIGGREHDLATWRRRATWPNLHFHGFVPNTELGTYYAHFDVVLLPQQEQVTGESSASQIGRWTSPLKAFEYMAHHKPIVASDLPVLREIFRDGHNALMVQAGEPDAWCQAIQKLTADHELARQLADAAHTEMMKNHTWKARAQSVVEMLM